MKDCIFCRIANGEIPCEMIYEDDNFISFSDANPVGEGHSLVIPKKHFETILDLDKDSGQKYIVAIQETAKILMKKHKSDGFNIVVNTGEAAGQIVKHVHFHLLPRKEGDKMRGIFIG